jgi:hypothetical protein
MGIIDYLSMYIDTKIELHELRTNPPKDGFFDPVVIPPSIIEENLRQKEQELIYNIQEQENIIQEFLGDLK